jgi:hypothetical protein
VTKLKPPAPPYDPTPDEAPVLRRLAKHRAAAPEMPLRQTEDGPSLIVKHPRCLIPWFDGAILSQEWKEALWARFVTGAPRPRTPSELQYNDRKLRSQR